MCWKRIKGRNLNVFSGNTICSDRDLGTLGTLQERVFDWIFGNFGKFRLCTKYLIWAEKEIYEMKKINP